MPEAEQQRRAIYERYVASQEALEHEMGAEAARALQFEAERSLGLIDGIDYLRHSRRIFVVARKEISPQPGEALTAGGDGPGRNRRTLMRPPVVKRQTILRADIFAFFPLFRSGKVDVGLVR